MFAPENAVIHRGVLFKMSIYARTARLGQPRMGA